MPDEQQTTGPGPVRYRWPWFVLAAVVLGVILAVVWMSYEVKRTRRSRQWPTPAPLTNSPAARPPAG